MLCHTIPYHIQHFVDYPFAFHYYIAVLLIVDKFQPSYIVGDALEEPFTHMEISI